MRETTTVRVISVTRLRNTPSGNARYNIETTSGTYRTRANSACAYDIAHARIGMHVTLELSRAGYVIGIARDRAACMADHPSSRLAR